MDTNRLQGLTDEQVDTYRAQFEGPLKCQNLSRDEVVISQKILNETILTLEHAKKFITSRNKMHVDGVQLYDECLGQLVGINFPKPSKDNEAPCGECRLTHGEQCDICGAVAD